MSSTDDDKTITCDLCGITFAYSFCCWNFADDLSGVMRDICHGCQDKHGIHNCEGCNTWRRNDQFTNPDNWICDLCLSRDPRYAKDKEAA